MTYLLVADLITWLHFELQTQKNDDLLDFVKGDTIVPPVKILFVLDNQLFSFCPSRTETQNDGPGVLARDASERGKEQREVVKYLCVRL